MQSTAFDVQSARFRVRGSRAGFTLIEMLVVVVVLVTLMTMVFRLSSIGDDSTRRVTTVTRLQKLEFCLSGYYAAFGSYPQVPLHASQDYTYLVGARGMQLDDQNENVLSGNESIAWRQVEAACRAQPVACRFPFSSGFSEIVDSVSEEIKQRINDGDPDYEGLTEERKAVLLAGFDDGVSKNFEGRFSEAGTETSWQKIQLFQFGLMSFLLPRYKFMLQSDVGNGFYGKCAQWKANNSEPCDPFTGQRQDWNYWQNRAKALEQGDTEDKLDAARFANIPSQAACARWMPNLAGICEASSPHSFFGINVNRVSHGSFPASPNIQLFSPNEDSESGSGGGQQYVLDKISVEDGWGRELYYYSPAPYQTYSLWSAGPNGKTFPPWISRANLKSDVERKLVAKWTLDDIVHMSN